jgi:cobalt transporter subunit CbtA
MFKRIAQTAGFAGLVAAIVLTLLQSLWVTPLIIKAEGYEPSEPQSELNHSSSAPLAHEHAAESAEHVHAPTAAAEHQHDPHAWSPDDGWQRSLATGLSNLVMAVGFALILAGIFTLRGPHHTSQGLLWGLAGFAAFSLAPAAGLPPELPGTAAAELGLRQIWWITTASVTVVGLSLLAFGKHWSLRIGGALLLAIPHLFGAPQPEVHASLAPAAMSEEFIRASLLTNALFWTALGLAAAWFFRRSAVPA